MLWAFLVVCVVAIVWIGWSIHCIGRVSRGRRANGTGTALVLIDLQKAFWNSATYDDLTRERVEAAVADAVQMARAKGDPVIALRQEWSTPGTRLVARVAMKGTALAGNPDTALAAPFTGLADHEVIKGVQDGFETRGFQDLLDRLNIGALRIAGLDGQFCVKKTAMAALGRSYDVTLIEKAIATANPDAWALVRARLQALGASFE